MTEPRIAPVPAARSRIGRRCKTALVIDISTQPTAQPMAATTRNVIPSDRTSCWAAARWSS
jgi:hypothetical protein